MAWGDHACCERQRAEASPGMPVYTFLLSEVAVGVPCSNVRALEHPLRGTRTESDRGGGTIAT